jgi:hypothetical protein
MLKPQLWLKVSPIAAKPALKVIPKVVMAADILAVIAK